MDDFRAQLAAHLDAMLAAGVRPVFLIVDLAGAGTLKRAQNTDMLDRFRETAAGAVSSVAGGCETFTYGDERLVAVLGDVDRLRSFAMVEKLQRVLPLLAQSFDCPLHADFDFIEYDERTGVAGLIGQLATQLKRDAA